MMNILLKTASRTKRVLVTNARVVSGFLYAVLFALKAMCFLTFSVLVGATSIESLNGDQLLERAQLVFEGQVLAITTAQTSKNMIMTEVEFDVQEVLFGDYDKPRIKLKFVGGKVGDARMNVAEMIYPDTGEQGVYFVESIDQVLVNPLVGWSQGQFIYQRDQHAVERVCTAYHNPIMSIEFDSSALDSHQSNSVGSDNHSGHAVDVHGAHGAGVSHGYVRGISIARSARDVDDALTSRQFKDQVKARIKARRNAQRNNKTNGSESVEAHDSGGKQ